MIMRTGGFRPAFFIPNVGRWAAFLPRQRATCSTNGTMTNLPTPTPTTALPQVRLKIARRSSHPWVFQKMVEKPATRLPGGSVVDVLDRDGQWVGRGFYNGHSRIALRVLTADPAEAVDDAFFERRLARAVELRRGWLGLDAVADAYRLVHSEADGL